jgi:shikimate dehydrogenase
VIKDEHIESHEIIVNCTPLGTSPDIDEKPEIPYGAIDKRHLLVDLVYNPPETAFLREGILAGASTVNGYNMLINQAEASWEIWNKS